MSTLTSASTDSDVWAAYDDNASYDEDGSTTKAKAFRTACRFLLRRQPKRATDGLGSSVEFNPDLIQKEMDEANDWLRANSTTSGGSRARALGMNNYRG